MNIFAGHLMWVEKKKPKVTLDIKNFRDSAKDKDDVGKNREAIQI